MNYVEKLLARNERIVRITRDHWITLLPTILIDAAIIIVIIGLSTLGIVLSPPWTWFGFVLLLAPIGHLVLRIEMWLNEQHIITNRRVLQVTGTFSKRVSDTSLDKINDILMEQSALGRALNFGNIEIISGSESGIDVFRHIADPIGFKKELLNQKETLTSPDISKGKAPSAGDIPELIAELDELRQQGTITDAEFKAKKQQLLTQI